MFAWRTDQISAAETQILSYGIAVIEEPAATVGITAVPLPGADAASEAWFYHRFLASDWDFITGVGFDSVGRTHMIEVDSKAMRKLQDNQRIVVVVQNQGPFGIDVISQLRFLSKLS